MTEKKNKKFIPYGRQFIDEEDIQSVVEVLKSDFITQGPIVKSFAENLSNKLNCKYATATNSATSALQIAYLSLGLSKNDILWTSPNTFVATTNAALHCGAKVDFIDIDPDTYNIDLNKSFIIGDRTVDIKTGENAKIKTVLVKTGYAGNDRKFDCNPDYNFLDFNEAISKILNNE